MGAGSEGVAASVASVRDRQPLAARCVAYARLGVESETMGGFCYRTGSVNGP